MKRTAVLACALMAVCASLAHAESPAASAGQSTEIAAPAVPFDVAAVMSPIQLADATIFVAGMAGAFAMPQLDLAHYFATHAAHDSRGGFDVSAAFSPPLYEQAPPLVHAISKRAARHSRSIDRWDRWRT